MPSVFAGGRRPLRLNGILVSSSLCPARYRGPCAGISCCGSPCGICCESSVPDSCFEGSVPGLLPKGGAGFCPFRNLRFFDRPADPSSGLFPSSIVSVPVGCPAVPAPIDSVSVGCPACFRPSIPADWRSVVACRSTNFRRFSTFDPANCPDRSGPIRRPACSRLRWFWFPSAARPASGLRSRQLLRSFGPDPLFSRAPPILASLPGL